MLQVFLTASPSAWSPGAHRNQMVGECEQDMELYSKLTLLPKIQQLSLTRCVMSISLSCKSSPKLCWTTYPFFRKGSLRESLLGWAIIVLLWYVVARKMVLTVDSTASYKSTARKEQKASSPWGADGPD